MNKKSIKASDGSVVITGQVQGSVTTNSKEKKAVQEDDFQQSKVSKIPIFAAAITALGAIVSGFLIAASNFFGS